MLLLGPGQYECIYTRATWGEGLLLRVRPRSYAHLGVSPP